MVNGFRGNYNRQPESKREDCTVTLQYFQFPIVENKSGKVWGGMAELIKLRLIGAGTPIMAFLAVSLATTEVYFG